MPVNINGRELVDVHVNGQDLQTIWARGEQVWPTTIEDFEGIDDYQEVLRGTFTGSTDITADAALATGQGSTQGFRNSGFCESYALPGDHETPLEAGREASFFFRPVDFDAEDQFHFILAPQESADNPPDESYRFEFLMEGGSRITYINGGRQVIAEENESTWSPEIYECRFVPDTDGITMTCNGQTLQTTNTDYIADIMGFGFRASGGGTVDYDWLSY